MNYLDFGYSQFLTRTIQAPDPNYMTASQFNAKIQDNSITNSKIRNLTADKIDAGTIDASVITVTNLNADEIASGKIESSDGKTYFDLDNNRIIVNDGTNDRVLIGYQLNGF